MALDPHCASNQFVYIYYTATTPTIHNRVSRFTASGDVAVPGSEVVLLDFDDLTSAANHNGGAIHFGRDGKLYIAVGENATPSNARTLSNLLGKILRINANGTIPIDNPFFNTATGKNRAIWALGLRNPFTFAFQPSTSVLFINDVGQNSWEEINRGIRGANYGWPATEGETTDPRYVSPPAAAPAARLQLPSSPCPTARGCCFPPRCAGAVKPGERQGRWNFLYLLCHRPRASRASIQREAIHETREQS